MTDTHDAVSTVSVTVNGNEIEGNVGELLIDACERNGTYIPRFCYHPRMTPVGMCRMCLVEVDTGRGPSLQPSCMLPVSDGMTVDTESELTKKAQDGVLEFLLINHPLDCPVCDKGGECPLQDQTMAFGPGESRFIEEKRHFEKPIAISDTVYLDRERCILCDRCTRFADEVAGDTLIHFMDRGNNTQVNTFPNEPFASYFSGNTVQICPVGALTATPYRFKARPWDLEENLSTAWTDSVGSRITVQSSRNKVLRVLGVDSDSVNWGWLSDKERFAFEALNSAGRITQPLARADADADLASTGWAAAMQTVVDVLTDVDPARVGVIGGARLTNESQYAWSKLAKSVIGTDNVDAQLSDGLPAEVVLGLPRATIADACRPGGTIILVGPDPKEDLGALFLRLRHTVVNDGARLIELTPHRTGLSGIAAHSLHPRPGEVGNLAAALVAARSGVAVDAAGVSADAIAAAAASISGPITVVLGRASLAESSEAVVDAAAALNGLANVSFLSALRRGNVHGAIDAGLAPGLLPGRTTLVDGGDAFTKAWGSIPDAPGLDTAGMLAAAATGDIDVLVLLGADPLSDFPEAAVAEAGLRGAATVIAIDTLPNASVLAHADVVLPAAAATEVDGTFTNLEGRVSVCEQKVTPCGTARADWMIAAQIASRLGADLGIDSPAAARAELAALSSVHGDLTEEALGAAGVEGVLCAGNGSIIAPVANDVTAPINDAYSLRLVATRRMYDAGTTLAHSPSSAGLAASVEVRLNPTDFDKLGVSSGSLVKLTSSKGELMAPVVADLGVPVGSAAIPTNSPDANANRLIDASQSVTDVRVERS
ncbi:MAG: NADH-quinone oxidoreductase subunit NuoG [Acidimicrobiaceae bacterium]|jgi:NADH-quinone oxidoreductase subunit G|nr:NADH-quinone oxidoreductase subunit NuoG [Acidimicrobiaceae bacterium]MBT5579368.1 NADH-quinone oxidoreductase subunit NuoG [Acidimicrobiaceae bacterium]MBT5849765.1 NADH-quinone oxidoreductase subunit NuoG [Acidimicrobiaceae bacterium]